ncbi:hypothetical protein, partial [Salinicola sp. MH3R3-1]|uniref:hypothetical protein n=1 Tax=Salinicola sp. MH3R3-1 TaxID=1928762 RepID=UPI001AEFE8BD
HESSKRRRRILQHNQHAAEFALSVNDSPAIVDEGGSDVHRSREAIGSTNNWLDETIGSTARPKARLSGKHDIRRTRRS